MAGKFNPDEYINVHERIALFYEKYPEGRIVTELVSQSEETGAVVMKAHVYRKHDDAEPAATGHACEVKGGGGANQTSHVENAETSAVGRAIMLLGFDVKRQPARAAARTASRPAPPDESDEAHAAVDEQIIALRKQLDKTDEDLTKSARTKYPDTQLDNWNKLNMEGKTWLLGFLQKKAKTAARG